MIVTQNENIKYFENCDNYFTDNYFDVDLWQSLHVKYIISKENKSVSFNIYGFEFICAEKFDETDRNGDIIYLKEQSDYDTVYTISKNGFSERRLNEWQK